MAAVTFNSGSNRSQLVPKDAGEWVNVRVGTHRRRSRGARARERPLVELVRGELASNPPLDIRLVFVVEGAGKFGQHRCRCGSRRTAAGSVRLDELLVEGEWNDDGLRLAVRAEHDRFCQRAVAAKALNRP